MNEHEVERTLRDLIRLTQEAREHDWPPSEPFALMGLGTGTVLFVDDGLSALHRLKTLASGHALAEGGPHPKVVEGWAVTACRDARGDLEAAVHGFMAHLDEPLRAWRVATPILDLLLPDHLENRLDVAGCTVREGLPPDLDLQVLLDGRPVLEHYEPRFDAMVICTTVQARDLQSAKVAAIDRFQAARAILSLASGNDHRREPDAVLVDESGNWGMAGSEPRMLPWPRINPSGSTRVWAEGWQELSDAAVTPETMNEWAERVLTAARWLHRSRTTWWTSERIATCFFALEALLLHQGHGRGKGEEIANQLTKRWPLRDRDADSQQKWLKGLYGRERTSAVHTGRRVERDLDADALEELTHATLKWGIAHLSPFHRVPNVGCTSFDEVMDPAAHKQ